MRRRWLLALAVALLGTVGAVPVRALRAAPGPAAPAEEETDDPVERDPLAAAPEGTWPMRDGCPARTQATRTPAIEGPTEIAWSYDAPGLLESEPVVDGDRVVVASSAADGRARHLDVLSLATGRPVVARRTTTQSRPLAPVIWKDFVFASTDSAVVDVLRIAPESRAFSVARSIASYDPPIVMPDGDLVVSHPRGFEVRRAGVPGAVLSATFEGRRLGRLSVRGGWVYAVTSRVDPGYVGAQALLERVELSPGRSARRQVCVLGPTDLPSADTYDESFVSVGREEAIAFVSPGIRLRSGRDATAVAVRLGASLPSGGFLLHAESIAATWGDRTFLLVGDGQGRSVLAERTPAAAEGTSDRRGWLYTVLATSSRHAGLLADGAPPRIADGVVCVGTGCFDARTRRILSWGEAGASPRRVPARDRVLVVSSPRRLDCRRRASPGTASVAAKDGPAFGADAAGPVVVVAGATIATIDGMTRTADLSVDPKARTATPAGARAIPFDEIALVLDADGRLVHGPDAGPVVRALSRAIRSRSRAAWSALARASLGTNDVRSVTTAIADVLESGVDAGEDAVWVELQRERTRLEAAHGADAPPVAAKVAEVARDRAARRAADVAAAWRAFASIPERTPILYRLDLLRAVLAADPAQPQAVAWLHAHLPSETLSKDAPAAAGEWLDVVEAAAQAPLRGVRGGPGAPTTSDERALASARARWRPDLVGLRSANLLILTPVGAPARIARCLSLGEVLCTTLDGLFRVTPSSAAAAEPLVVYLYGSKEEYVARSDPRGGSSGWVESTLGHYSPSDRVSRLYVPGEKDAFEKVSKVFAHELTHHWLDRRMPSTPGVASRTGGPSSPGCFVEEGFAEMVEEFELDLRARTVRTTTPRADSLDVVAASSDLLPWASVVDATWDDLQALSKEPAFEVPVAWSLGEVRRLSPTNLFYAQSAAIARYLFDADEGTRRGTLLAWVRDLHEGRTRQGDVTTRTGLSADELGARVRRFAETVVAGR